MLLWLVFLQEAVPDEAELQRAQALVREVFKEDFSRKDPLSRRALARTLLKQALDSKEGAAARFVLLREAREIAADAGDVETCLSALDETVRSFKLDVYPLRKSALEKLKKTAGPADQRLLAEAWMASAEQAADPGDYDGLLAELREAERWAQKSKELPLVLRIRARIKEVEAAKADRLRVVEAEKKLALSPGDPPASLVIGRHLCLFKGDWEKGLPLLALASDPLYKDAASADLAAPADGASRLAVADRWWEVVSREEGTAKNRAGERAAMWYSRALPLTTGLSKAKVEKRLEELSGLGILLAPARGLIGWWTFDEGAGEIANDKSGRGAAGQLQKGPAWVPGKIGSALSFDGKDDGVVFQSKSFSQVSNTFTLAFWALPKAERKSVAESAGGVGGLSGQRFAIIPENTQNVDGPGHANAGVSVGTNGIGVFEHTAHYLPALLMHEMPIGDWVHIAVVYVDRQPRLYVGGQLVRTGMKSTKTVHPGLAFGAVRMGSYAGLLDDVRYYDRALEEAELRALAASR